LGHHGRWHIEPRRRSHAARWAEVRNITNPLGLPSHVTRAFQYASCGSEEPVLPLNELTRGGPAALAHLRHEALYGGFGFDGYAFDAVMNGEAVSAAALSLRARMLRALAVGLIGDSVPVLNIFWAWRRAATASTKRAADNRLRLAVILPAFESSIRAAEPVQLPGEAGKVERDVRRWAWPGVANAR